MEPSKTHYPNYRLLDEQEQWDEHTREIVCKRLETPGSFQKLTGEEVEQIRAMASLFVDDGRTPLLDFIVKHFDQLLSSDKGENQRKPGVPQQKDLIKQGLAAMERLAIANFGLPFVKIRPEQQIALLVQMENDTVTLPMGNGQSLPASVFFQKMLSVTVTAYYSHPQVWSEIGYGGPAYPRGYVRTELGLTDPWEARQDA